MNDNEELEAFARNMAREMDRWAEEQMRKVCGPVEEQLPLTVERFEEICGIQRTHQRWRSGLAKLVGAYTIPTNIVIRTDVT